MIVRFLGTGWSHGVPMIGCSCEVCLGKSPRNLRRRPSIHLEADGFSLIVDTGPDFRDQVLANGIQHLDALAFTHAHADHMMGFDDVRRFTWKREEPLRVFGMEETLDAIRESFHYVSPRLHPGQAVPKVVFEDVRGQAEVGPFAVEWIQVPHGRMPCWGLVIRAGGRAVGYIPDTADLGEPQMRRLQGLDVMILNALRKEPHPSHLTWDRSIELLQIIAAEQSFLTHMGCSLDYDQLNQTLPAGLEMAYDGLVLDL